MDDKADKDGRIAALDVYFPETWRHKSDSDIEGVSRILELNNRISWSKSPRLYSVLRMIDRLDLMDKILAQGLTDFLLPVPTQYFRELELPPQFQEAQQYVLTRKFTGSTKWPYRGHLNCSNEKDLPFTVQSNLGAGGWGEVSEIYDYSAQRVLAKKSIRRHRFLQSPQLENEVKIHRRLSHRHCVEFVGSYTTPRSVSILMTPVAECSLRDFLESNTASESATKNGLVQSWFGCLTSALLYLHNNNIRHADIKPGNILLANNVVFLTDFGISIDWTGKRSYESENEVHAMTIRYASPERGERAGWDGSSDIWALGCVFLELLTTLVGFSQDHLRNTLLKEGSLGYYNATKAISTYIQSLQDKDPASLDDQIGMLVQNMLAYEQRGRPSANQIASRLREKAASAPQWCGPCCINTLTDDQEAREGLHHFVGSQNEFSEVDVQYIGRKLAFEQMTEWSNIPRTYIVLVLIDSLDLISSFLRAGVSDIWFPYDRQLLRQIVKVPQAIQSFLEKQNAVLSSKLLQYEHQYFIDGNDHLQDIRELGSGGFGSVWHSFDPETSRHVAKKLIPRVKIVAQGRAKDAADIFERELAMLRRVSAEKHRHLIQMVGSYTDSSDFVILFSPVAEMNLDTYMSDPLSGEHLRRWFGCLATALQYLHRMQIRHKDIKPQNILVAEDTVILTDFGISYDWSDNTRPTTSGAGARDPRYCAPEVFDWEARNESADVWSLGCVFLEMQSVLVGQTVDDIRVHFNKSGTTATWYHRNDTALRSWLEILTQSSTSSPGTPLEWIRRMVVVDKDARASCDDIVESIINVSSQDTEREGTFCGTCCIDQITKEMSLD